MVAKVNLASAYVATENHTQSLLLLAEIRKVTLEKQWWLAYDNALESSTIAAISRRDWSEAREFLRVALERAKNLPPQEKTTLLKWQAILDLRQNGGANLNGIKEAKALAEKSGDWETTRDCDFHMALVAEDKELMSKVFFGTPYESFRQKMRHLTAKWFSPPQGYVWSVSESKPESDSGSARRFDFKTSQELGAFELTGMRRRLLLSLLSDFYRPLNLGTIYAQVYPGEHFNPYSSPAKINRLVERLRQSFAQYRIPLNLFVRGRTYWLCQSLNGLHGIYNISLPAPASVLLASEGDLSSQSKSAATLKTAFRDNNFSQAQAVQILGLSRRSTYTLLSWALDRQFITKSGTGRGARYRFVV